MFPGPGVGSRTVTTTQPSFHSDYRWHHELKQLFVRGLERYRTGEIDPLKHFNDQERAVLGSSGLTAQEFFDFVDDHVRYDGDPDWETVLLVNAVRRDYFLSEQHGQFTGHLVSMDELPAKDDKSVGGIPWLARVIQKAEAKLRGEMPPDLMYNCAGDRNFFREHHLHPADFLRRVWAARGDAAPVLAYVQGE